MIVREHNTLLVRNSATYSDCERYRYALTRVWDDSLPLINFLMLNPSTATERDNDQTIERCERRAHRLGYGGLSVSNLFAIRATYPCDMLADPHPIQEPGSTLNDEMILKLALSAGIIICAWGDDGSHLGRAAHVVAMLRSYKLDVTSKFVLRPKLHALKTNQSGHPTHPLYLPYRLKPVRLKFHLTV